jgi:hypothetical protein
MPSLKRIESDRQAFLTGLSDDFAALRENEPEWQAENAERAAWNIALADGVEQ